MNVPDLKALGGELPNIDPTSQPTVHQRVPDPRNAPLAKAGGTVIQSKSSDRMGSGRFSQRNCTQPVQPILGRKAQPFEAQEPHGVGEPARELDNNFIVKPAVQGSQLVHNRVHNAPPVNQMTRSP